MYAERVLDLARRGNTTAAAEEFTNAVRQATGATLEQIRAEARTLVAALANGSTPTTPAGRSYGAQPQPREQVTQQFAIRVTVTGPEPVREEDVTVALEALVQDAAGQALLAARTVTVDRVRERSDRSER